MTHTTHQVAAAYVGLIQSFLSYDEDQDQDQNQDQIKVDFDQDQIGSDEDLNHDQDKKRKESDLSSWFRTLCVTHGIECEEKDFAGAERNIVWVRDHLDEIRSPRSYLSKIVEKCPDRKPTPVGFRIPEKKDEPKPTTHIYGYPIEEVEALSVHMDERIWREAIRGLPDMARVLFRNFHEVMSNPVKKRVLTAEAMKRGILS